jgi:hypothetical protein
MLLLVIILVLVSKNKNNVSKFINVYSNSILIKNISYEYEVLIRDSEDQCEVNLSTQLSKVGDFMNSFGFYKGGMLSKPTHLGYRF